MRQRDETTPPVLQGETRLETAVELAVMYPALYEVNFVKDVLRVPK